MPSPYIFEDSIGQLTGEVSRELGKELERRFRAEGLEANRAQWVVLTYLANTNGQTQQQLADTARTDKTAMKRLIDALEGRSLVVRYANEKDKRSNLVIITQAGRDLHAKLAAIAGQMLAEAQDGLSLEELRQTRETLRKVAANLSAMRQKPCVGSERPA